MRYDEQSKARVALVKLIKDENLYRDSCKQSLERHWRGAAGGFADHMVQKRWHDYYAGWQARAVEQGE